MSIFGRIFTNRKRQNDDKKLVKKSLTDTSFSLTSDDDFTNFYLDPFKDTFLCNAWVNIAVNILIRNVARADFVLERDGVELKKRLPLLLVPQA